MAKQEKNQRKGAKTQWRNVFKKFFPGVFAPLRLGVEIKQPIPLLFCLLFQLSVTIGVGGAETSSYPPDKKIRAAYWGINSLEEAERQLRQLSTYGLNTALVSNSGYALDLALWQGWAELAQTHHIQLFPALNFYSQDERNLFTETVSPYVVRDGTVFETIPCPFDERYWNFAIGQRIEQLARLSTLVPIHGVLFDTEMYGSTPSLYQDVCLCDVCWQAFMSADSLRAELPKERRFAYLIQQQLYQRYETLQTERLQQLLSRIEQRVHAINPRLLLGCVAYRTNWFYAGLIKGLGTSDAPALVFSESSYVLGYTLHVDYEASVVTGDASDEPVYARYIPGLWFGRFFPEEIAAQAYQLAMRTDGYWLFSAQSLWTDAALPEPYALHGTPQAYWNALKIANDELQNAPVQSDVHHRGFFLHQASSFYDAAQQRLLRSSNVRAFLETIILPAARNLQSVKHRGKMLFHCLVNPANQLHIQPSSIRLASVAARYTLFDEEGFIILEGMLDAAHPLKTVVIPPHVSGVVSLMTDSGSTIIQVDFSGTPYIIEASALFPLTTFEPSRRYAFYKMPDDSRLHVRALRQNDVPMTIRLDAPDCQWSDTLTVQGFTEANIPLPENAISNSSQNFWTLAVTSKPGKQFEYVRFYLDEQFPYLLVLDNF